MMKDALGVLIIVTGIALGIGLPWFAVHHESKKRRDRRRRQELLRLQETVREHEATIEAYRRFIQSDPELSLTSL
ncbi:MAG: hypothetical protein ACYCPT_04565 [Acidimicrobiales bacterium]